MREKQLFNSGWSFHYGELPTEAPLAHISCYRHSKSFHRDGVHDPNYVEVNWSNYIKNGAKCKQILLFSSILCLAGKKLSSAAGKGFLFFMHCVIMAK